MNCFFLVVKDNLSDNKIVYVSKNINNYLGYSQDEILNNSLFHFILSSNHNKLRDYLNNNHQGF
jgi:PAS domain S-box-containing protein